MNIVKSDKVSIHGVALSMIGGRPENQDDMGFLDTPLGCLVIVCDGMGGGPGGKTASYIAKNEIAQTLCECTPQTPVDHALKLSVARACKALDDKMVEIPSLTGMGSTVVAVLINHQSAFVAHAGDSRFYRFHGKKCLYRTQDHSLVAELVKKRVMTEEDARLSPQSNVITRGLGSTNNHVPEINEIPYKKGDRFVLCTDGVWGAMPHPELLKILTQPTEIQKLVTDLSVRIDNMGFAKGGGHDNHTIVMFEMEKDSVMKDKPLWIKFALYWVGGMVMTSLFGFGLWFILPWNDKTTDMSHTSSDDISEMSPPNSTSTYEVPSETSGPAIRNSEPEGDAETKNGINDTLYNRILKNIEKLERKDSDSIAKRKGQPQKQEKTSANSKEIIQKLINRHDSVKTMSKSSYKDAQKHISDMRGEIKGLFVELCSKIDEKDKRETAERLCNVSDGSQMWSIDKADKKTGRYMLTKQAKGNIEKQVARLKDFMKSLEKKTK